MADLEGRRRFRLVDVFGERRYSGNPLAVVADSDGLAADEMLEITRWIGFSETTFLSPPNSPEADYKVRIFTLAGELPFAGHPTLGSCHVWQSLAGDAREEIVQECGAGLVRLRRSQDLISFEAPPLIRDGSVDTEELADLANVLGVDVAEIRAARWIDNGPGWVGIMLEDAEAVRSLQPDFSRSGRGEKLDIGVVGMCPEGSACRYEVRAFFSGARGEMLEDPVTGSLNASVAQWLIDEDRVKTPYVAEQGAALGRSGRIHISGDRDSVWVGGRVFDVAAGTLDTD